MEKTNDIIDTPYTADEIYEAYMSIHGGYLPCDKSAVNDFIRYYPMAASSPDLKYVVNMLFDYVGANQAYEKGCEEVW